MEDDEKYIGSIFLDMRKMDPNLIDKAKAFNRFVVNDVQGLIGHRPDVSACCIEDKLSGFKQGKTMQQTLLKLAAFNGVASYIISEVFPGAVLAHIHPSTVKSAVKLKVPPGGNKKVETLKLVVEREPGFVVLKNRNDDPQPYVYDMADSYIVALAGIRKRVVGKRA